MLVCPSHYAHALSFWRTAPPATKTQTTTNKLILNLTSKTIIIIIISTISISIIIIIVKLYSKESDVSCRCTVAANHHIASHTIVSTLLPHCVRVYM